METTCDAYENEIQSLKQQIETLKELATETKNQKEHFENEFLELKERFDAFNASGEEALEPCFQTQTTILEQLEEITNPQERQKFVLENMNELWNAEHVG